VGDVEHPYGFPHRGVFGDDTPTGKADRHLPPAERTEGGAGFDVCGV
jgi:hypothetical protein